MPSVAPAPLLSSGISFMVKEKLMEPFGSGFTTVNGRTSPPSPRKQNGVNGMNNDTIHVRPISRISPEETQDQKVPLPIREDWPAPARQENGAGHQRQSKSPHSPDRPGSPPQAFGKRKRSSSVEESEHSPGADSAQARRRMDSYTSVERDNSPRTSAHTQPLPMETSRDYHQVHRPEHDSSWAARDPRETVHNGRSELPHRESRGIDGPAEQSTASPTGSAPMSGVEGQNAGSGTTEITRAGVQVDPKKRKRQFANRTKTGCATCRRRKKKCDEAKPECNNCTRGGFICEGYAHRVPWPKNSTSKTHIPLQAKDEYTLKTPQLYHSHGHNNRESYGEQNGLPPPEGGRVRPIVLEEQERQATRNTWGTNWSEPPRPAYQPEHPPASEYQHQPSMTAPSRPPSHEHHVEHPAQSAPHQRQSVPPMYHHTPQPVGQAGVSNSPTVGPQHGVQHPAPPTHHHHHPPPSAPQHQPMHPPPAVAPRPQPPHHPKPQKTEKEKMVNGEYYLLFHPHLVDERDQCKAALYRFNSSSNPALGISREERDRHFRTIIEAPWIRQGPRSPEHSGTLGQDVFVDAPFTCEYGYNIHIGDAVVIGSNCTILDACRVSIGQNTIIGPNVSIFTNTVSTDPTRRNGSRGTAIAKSVEIGDNVFIGGNVIILPGIKVGKGATIGAGSVVTRNVPPHVVVSGNPATVRRGIWSEPYS